MQRRVAVTYDGLTTLKIYVNGNLNQTFTLPEPLNSTNATGSFGNVGSYFGGQIDEFSLYSRALTIDEIRAVVSVGVHGKLKERATAAVSNVSTQIASATINFPNVTTGGATREMPLDGATLPMLPTGSNGGALFIDVSTSAIYSGTPTVCFNVPSFTSDELRDASVFHLENGAWVYRTGTVSAAQICSSGLTSLSPFAIVPTIMPTAANVSISGRAVTADGRGITNLNVRLTNADGTIQTAKTSAFGYFRFDEIEGGQTVILQISGKKYVFSNSTKILNLTDNVSDIIFTADN